MRLDRRDYEAVLSFLEEAHAVEEPAPFTPHLLDRLASVAHCELATFFEFAPGTNLITVYVPCSKEDPTWRGVDDAWWTCTRTVELRRWKARSTGPVALADVFPRRLRVEPDFNLNYGEHGVADEIHVSLDRDRRWTAELGVFRERDFGERERLILQLLQPHLAALYRAATLRRRLGAASDAARLLTRREREVMTHVSNGLTNAEIARVLVIEPRRCASTSSTSSRSSASAAAPRPSQSYALKGRILLSRHSGTLAQAKRLFPERLRRPDERVSEHPSQPPQERRLTPPLSLVFDRPRRDATGATIRTHLSLEVPVRYPCLPERPNGWRAPHKGLAPAHLLGRHCRTLAQAEVLGLHPVHPSGSPHRPSAGVAPPLG